MNLILKSILIVGLTGKACFGQNSKVTCEQRAFDFFVDSLLQKENLKGKKSYYETSVKNNLSILKSPIGFNDYKKSIDSAEYHLVEKLQDSLRKVDVSNTFLNSKESSLIQRKTQSFKKLKLKKALLIRVNKTYIFRKNGFIVEIELINYDYRKHFFFELDIESLVVNRWYSMVYFL